MRLVKQGKTLVPEEAKVIFLGDDEFDGCQLLTCLDFNGWKYVCRSAVSSRLYYSGEEGSFGSLGLQKGDLIEVSEASFSVEGYWPVRLS